MATFVNSPIGSRGGHLLFAIVLAAHALLLSSQVTTERGHTAFKAIVIGVLSPFQRAASATVSTFSSTWNNYVDLRGVRDENERLRERVSRLEQSLWLERDLVASYRRLSGILELAERIPYDPIVAEVIGFDASAWFRTITVNRGTKSGVELNAPVVAAGGLVGRVISVGPSVAQIQLLTDRDCAVGALLTRNRIRGIVSGGDGLSTSGVVLNYVSNLEDVSEGDPIVTSGIDGIYHKGIAIGRVAAVRNGPRLFKIIAVEPAAQLDRLEEVFILPAVGEPEITDQVE